MDYNAVSFDKRVRENIRNYAIRNLFDIGTLTEYLELIAQQYGLEILLTDRHGEKTVEIGDFSGFEPDVVREPGEKLRVKERTVGHLYIRYDRVPQDKREMAEKALAVSMKLLTALGTEVYMHREAASYIDELEIKLEKEQDQKRCGEKEDILTGVFNKNCMESRMKVLDRAETVPVAVINFNINDWKFVYDHFGVEKSDSLIQVIAAVLKQQAKSDYIIGRIDGDVFLVLIPMAEEGEAEDYCSRVQKACSAYEEDPVLAPSVAAGIVYKTNVEERLWDRVSDAEYEMFNDKLKIKSTPGYQERLRRGIQ